MTSDRADPDVFLLGGGWSAAWRAALYGPFLDAAGAHPLVACLVVDEGDGSAQFQRWAGALRATAPCQPVPVLVPSGEQLAPDQLGDADALLVCGGLTPAYATALAPVAGEIRAWLAAGRPYAGFSAGAAVATKRAIVGGWRVGEVGVCPQEAGEDLDEVLVTDGVGLVPWLVDVHAAQWGTLGRLVAAAMTGDTPGLAIDEDTAVHVRAGYAGVTGAGAVHAVVPAESGAVLIRRLVSGDQVQL